MLHVPYKGSGPAVVALLAGDVSLMFDSISTSLPQVKAGKLKALAVTGAKRSALLPDVPTVAESGFPDFVVNGWYGILAPAKTPQPLVEKLNKAFADATTDPAVKKPMAGYGYEGVGSIPQDFGQHIEKELTQWQKIIKDAGVKIQ